MEYLELLFFILLILFVILFYQIQLRRNQLKENFYIDEMSGSKCTIYIQADNEYKILNNGQTIGTGDNWQNMGVHTINNLEGGEKIIFQITNKGGPGGFIFRIDYMGKEYYSNANSVVCNGIIVDDNLNITVGSKYEGCYTDTGNPRDLPNRLGENMTLKECAKKARDNNNSFFGLQFGGECWGGNGYASYGKSNNCDMRCTRSSSEICGGRNANKVFSTKSTPAVKSFGNRQANNPWRNSTNEIFGTNGEWIWVKSGDMEDDYAQDTWEFSFQLPIPGKIEVCTNPDFVEFNPLACSNPMTKTSCNNSMNRGYKSNDIYCRNLINISDYDTIYINLDSIYKLLGQIDDLANFNNKFYVTNMITKLKQNKKLINGHEFLIEFLNTSYNVSEIITYLAIHKLNYPIDNKQLTEDNLLQPGSPAFYNVLFKSRNWVSKNPTDYYSKNLTYNLNKLIKLSKIINGIPNISESCKCLFDTNTGSDCNNCESDKELDMILPDIKMFSPMLNYKQSGNTVPPPSIEPSQPAFQQMLQQQMQPSIGNFGSSAVK